jgi:hypothetical protein
VRILDSFQLVAFVLAIPGGSAATVSGSPAPTLAEAVSRAESIFAGTVDRAWVDGDRRVHEPVERVVFHRTIVLKGLKRSRISVSFWVRPSRGRPKDRARLRQGERYVVLTPEQLDPQRAGYTTITAREVGLFPVRYDARPRKSVVHDPANRPIVRVDRDRIVVVETGGNVVETGAKAGAVPVSQAAQSAPWIQVIPAAQDPGTRLGEGEFLDALRELVTSARPPR